MSNILLIVGKQVTKNTEQLFYTRIRHINCNNNIKDHLSRLSSLQIKSCHYFSTDNSRIQQVYSPTCFDWISRTDQDENVHSWQNNYFSSRFSRNNIPIKNKYASLPFQQQQFIEEMVELIKLGKPILDKVLGNQLLPELIAIIIDKSFENCPSMPSTSTGLEIPYFKTANKIHYDIPYYNFINSRIPILYELIKINEVENDGSSTLLYPYRIWLYYHMNDLELMKQLQKKIDIMINNQQLNEKTILYYLSTFINNYEIIEFKKNFHKLIINTQYNLSNSLINSLTPNLIGHDCLFEDLFFIYQLWMNSPKCQPPLIKTISLLLLEFYRFGTNHELKEFKRLIKKYQHQHNMEYYDHYLIQSIDYQYEIINREYLSFTKNITEEDLQFIESIAPKMENYTSIGVGVGDDDNDYENVIEFYHRWLYFMIRYSKNMDNINFIFKLYKNSIATTTATNSDNNNNNDQFFLPPRFFKILLDYYVKHDQFIPMLQLIEASKTSIPYDPSYLILIAKTFIYSYSRFAPQFIDRLNGWIGKSSFQLKKSWSPFHPYRIYEPLNRIKYNDPQWEEFRYDKRSKGNRYNNNPNNESDSQLQQQQQIEFRVNRGFENLINRGIRPDINLLLETFKFTTNDLNYRLKIKSLMMETRQYNHKNSKFMELISLNHPSLQQEDLLRYYITNSSSQLNDSHKFLFIKMLIDYELYEEAQILINSIDDDANVNSIPPNNQGSNLLDKYKMLKLILQLKIYVLTDQFELIIDSLNKFAIHEKQIYLTPYLLDQTLLIENMLFKKLRSIQKSSTTTTTTNNNNNSLDDVDDQESSSSSSLLLLLGEGKKSLMKLRHFIGDVKLMLENDENEIMELIDKTIYILNQWKDNNNNNNNR